VELFGLGVQLIYGILENKMVPKMSIDLILDLDNNNPDANKMIDSIIQCEIFSSK
jgi:hypothetical protein